MPSEPPRGVSRHLVQAGLLVLAGLALTSLYHRSCYIDDAWLGERAYWLAREGVVRSELFRGQLDYGERMFVFHKLFALTGATFIRLFGWSLYVLKSVSLVSFLAFLALLWRYCRRFESRDVFVLTVLVLLGHGLVGSRIFVYRPEVMLMALGFGCFFLLRSFLEGTGWPRATLAGGAVLAGLGALAHLNGLMFIAAGTLLLLLRRRPGPAAVFAVLASSVAALYLADAVLAGEVSALWRQLLTDPMLVQRIPDVGSHLTGLLSEHQRYFHSLGEILFSLLVLVTVVVTARFTELRTDPLVPFTVALAVSLALLSPERHAHYAIPLLPYLALIVAVGAVRGLPRAGRAGRAIVVALLWVHVAHGALHFGQMIAAREDTAARNRALASHIPPRATVVATLPFVFDEIESRTVHGLEYYWVKSGYGQAPIPPDVLFGDARARGARYAIMSREDLRFSGWPEGAPSPSGSHHRELYRDADYLILELF